MYGKIQQHLQNELATIKESGLYKKERIITSPQGEITISTGETVLNFCAITIWVYHHIQKWFKQRKTL